MIICSDDMEPDANSERERRHIPFEPPLHLHKMPEKRSNDVCARGESRRRHTEMEGAETDAKGSCNLSYQLGDPSSALETGKRQERLASCK